MLVHDLEGLFAIEGHAAGEHLVREHAEGVDVRAPVDRAAPALLGRHEVGRADEGAVARAAGVGLAQAEELGDAEVEQLRPHLPVDRRDEHVLGLEVAVHHAGRVGGRERRGHVAQRRQRPGDRHRPPPRQALRERLALEQLHHVVVPPVVERAEAEDVDDVAVPNAVDRPRLLDEARDRGRVVRKRPVQHLDRRRFADERVGDAVHPPEPPLAQQPLDHVLADPRARGQRRLGRPQRRGPGAIMLAAFVGKLAIGAPRHQGRTYTGGARPKPAAHLSHGKRPRPRALQPP